MIRIGRISFTTADADRLGAFYRQAFGFEAMEVEHHGGTSFARLTGIEGAQARAVPLRLGEQHWDIVEITKARSAVHLFQSVEVYEAAFAVELRIEYKRAPSRQHRAAQPRADCNGVTISVADILDGCLPRLLPGTV